MVLQSNRRLLDISLAAALPNAAVEYDRRAADIKAIARENLETGTGIRHEVEQT